MPSNSDIMKALLAKLYLATTGESSRPSNTETHVAFCSPGYPVTPETFKIGRNTPAQLEAARTFSYLVNTIPVPDNFFHLSGKTTWSVYQQVLQESNVIESRPSADEEKALQAARALLDEKVDGPEKGSAKYDLYNEYSAKHEQALADLYSLREEAVSLEAQCRKDENLTREWRKADLAAARQEKVVDRSFNDWVNRGYKEEIEEALGTIAMVTKRSGRSRFNELAQGLRKAETPSANGSFYYTSYFPANLLDSGWTRFWFKLSEVEQYKDQFNGKIGGDFKAGMDGIFNFRAKGEAELKYAQTQADTSDLSISFEMAQLPVFRPWWDATVFENRGWKWRGGSTHAVSSGNLAAGDLMPLYVTDVILARNLKVTMNTKSEKNKEFLAKAQLEGTLGLGPFVIKGAPLNIDMTGSLSGDFTRTALELKQTDDGIMVEGMQVIGFACRKVPKSPNPDESLPWTK